MLTFIGLFFSSRVTLIAENLFLRRQLALFRERKARPRRTTPALRMAMVGLARFFNWRDALVIVEPETFLKWNRAGFRLFWRWKSRKRGPSGIAEESPRVSTPDGARQPYLAEERIADELSLKLGIHIAARTVRKYPDFGKPRGSSGQRWRTFVRNHAQAIMACDFFVSATASFRIVCVFVAMENGSRRILHTNVTQHPTAEWTIQQVREFLEFDHAYRFVIRPMIGRFLKTPAESLVTICLPTA